MAKYKGVDIDTKPTEAMAKAAKRGLDMRDNQPPSKKGMTQVGLTRARQLISREELSIDTVKRMYSFFSRHEVDKTSDSWKKGNSKGEQAWLGWGGDPGYSWSRKITERVDKIDEEAKGSMKTNKLVERDGKWFVYDESGSENVGKKDGWATKSEAQAQLDAIEIDKAKRAAMSEQKDKVDSEYFKSVSSNAVMVNITQVINAADITMENIDGDDHYIIPSATLPDNIVMNGGLYPAEEIEKGYRSLEGVPAPVGHPVQNGKYVSARDVRAINQFHVGAYVRNVRRENGRVFHDTVVNKRVAMQSEKGRSLIEAIQKGDPIHSSTGVFLNQEMMLEPMRANKGPSKGKEYSWIARNLVHDHQAILLNEPGAATPEEGVGLLVNGEKEQEFAVLFGNLEQPEPQLPQGWLDKIVTTVTNVLKSQSNEQPTFEVNAMSQLLKDKLTALHVNFKDDATEAELLALHTEAVIAANQVDVEALKAEIKKDVEAEIKANAEAEAKADLVSEIQELKGNTLTEDELKASPLAVLKQIKSSLTPKGNATVLPSPVNNSSAQVTYDEMPD